MDEMQPIRGRVAGPPASRGARIAAGPLAMLVPAVLTAWPATAGANAVEAEVVYTGEFWRNTTGGLQEGGVYVDNLDVTLTVNGGEAFGIEGLTLFAYGLYNNGNELSGRYAGDAQVISNIETGVRATRLYELWADWAFGRDRAHSLRFGLYDLNSEFDAIDSASLFINSSHGIGADIAQTGENGPSIFPVTSLALRWRWQPAENWAVQLVALDGVPGDPEDPDATTIEYSSDEGALLVGEIHWYGERVRKAALGTWRYTADFEDVLATTPGGDPVERTGNSGVYGFADVVLLREQDDPEQGLTGWLRYGVADDDVNQFESYTGFGLVYTGLVPGRPEDQLGLGFAIARNGDPFMAAVRAEGLGVDRRETNIELTYRAAVTDWLTLQPNLQYVRNPGTDPELDDAFAIGLRFEVGWAL